VLKLSDPQNNKRRFKRHEFVGFQSISMKYLRINHFWIDDIIFAHTCVIEAQDFLDNRFGGDFDFGCYDTLRQKRLFYLCQKFYLIYIYIYIIRLNKLMQKAYRKAFSRLH